MLGNRGIKQVLGAVVQKQHYIALINMARAYPSFFNNTARYLTGKGHYPYKIQIKTPMGLISPSLYSHHDILTVNEIFCRLDYSADSSINTVVDLGSNIGISALYFLSRNRQVKCYLYEPVPENVVKLRQNLSGYEDRYDLYENAVSYKKGQLEFGVESTGRYGGIGVKTNEKIVVDCIEVNDVLHDVLSKEDSIDILKIDTEGVEEKTVDAIHPDLLSKINIIYLEATPKHDIHPDIFVQSQYGCVCQLNNKFLN